MFWTLAATAVLVASQVASGWWVAVLAVVIWAGGMLLLVLAGLCRGGAEGKPLPVSSDTPESCDKALRVAGQPSGPCLIHGSAPPGTAAATLHAAPQGNGWHLSLDVLGISFNERWPRTDICITREYFLRSGDRLLLRYAPRGATPAGQSWHCDISGRWCDGGMPRREVQVSATRFVCIPIPHDGVYEIGVGQGDPSGTEHGQIEAWLETDSPDRLAQSNEPQQESGARWHCDAAGQWRVEIVHESTALDRAAMPARQEEWVPPSAVVLFDPRHQAWDEAGIADPTTDWEAERRHVFRYYLQLCRGDVLAIEYAWRPARFGVPMDDGNSISFTNGELELTQFVRSPTLLSVHTGWSEATEETSRVMMVTCPDDGFFQIELTLYGPAAWRTKRSPEFLELRVLGVQLRRPAQVRDFSLVDASVEDWYRRTVPVPRHALARRGPYSDTQQASDAQA
ncbi:hypothetical protein [Cupriavidus sp. MP-37]|uniref:hypothetical protein n=1 Tax=Cupriavidus sp. MP-37 TaxID=2884455 RepID=UPI001D0AF827|nr:hypothetical protein [Cupriavidus sp. MP-37]UDM53047.1 hypothetical protein LIN44_17080 [Cupriavidus sp. MP-37]